MGTGQSASLARGFVCAYGQVATRNTDIPYCIAQTHASCGANTLNFDTVSLDYAVAAAACMGLGYAVWNIGISRGNLTVLAGASYFIPVLSAVVSSFLISAPLSMTFWQGAGMVCLGSIVCWLATRR